MPPAEMLHRSLRPILFCALALAACNESGGSGGGGNDADVGADIVPGTERSVQRVDALGVQGAGDCSGGTGAEFDFLFGIVDRNDTVVAPGSNVNGRSLILNDTFTSTDISFDDVTLYRSPEVPCASDADCSAIPGGFTCRSLNDEVGDAATVCATDASVEIIQDSLRFLPEQSVAREKAVLVLIANGSSILGLNTETGQVDDRFSTDPDDERIDAVLEFVEGIRDAFPAADSTACLAWFTGEGSPSVQFIPDVDGCLQSLEDVGSDIQQSRLRQITLTGEGVNQGQRSNWAALRVAIEHLSSSTSATFDRHVVMFTDGEDNGSNAAARQTPEFVAELAQINGVRLHVVQLDNPPNGAGIGPIGALHDVACQSEGTYLYASAPDTLLRQFRNLSFSLANRYALRMRVPELVQLPAGDYRIAALVSFDVNGESRTLRLLGDNTDVIGADADSRLVVSTR